MAEIISWLSLLPPESEGTFTFTPAPTIKKSGSAERMRKLREKRRMSDARDASLSVEGGRGESVRGSEKEADKKGIESQIGLNLTGESGNDVTEVTRHTVTQRKRKRAPEVPFPDDFKPTDSHRAYCAKHSLDLELEVDSLKGWAEGRTAVSWNGTFSTRLANSVKFRRERPSGTNINARTRPAQPSHGVTGFEKAVFVR